MTQNERHEAQNDMERHQRRVSPSAHDRLPVFCPCLLKKKKKKIVAQQDMSLSAVSRVVIVAENAESTAPGDEEASPTRCTCFLPAAPTRSHMISDLCWRD